jgi:CBS domain-containing protein/phage shock protein A
MFGDQERVTVRELMTEDPQEVHPAATVADVREWLDEKGYTAAPLARDEPPFMYVTRQGLADASAEAIDDPVYEHAERFGLDDLVAPDLGFEGLLRELEDRPFYFVGWHGRVEGIVTRADLNKPAAHAFLYTRVGELEMRLRDLLDAETSWQGALSMLQREGAGEETEYDAVLEEYEAHAGSDLQLREIDYTTFWQLTQCVREEATAVEHLPFEDGESAAAALNDIRELRNHVAHYGNVVHNLDADTLSSGRNVHELEETYADIEATLEALREWSNHETGRRPVGAVPDE